jgi:hypothetical protein
MEKLMKAIWRSAPATTLLWSSLAGGQSPPATEVTPAPAPEHPEPPPLADTPPLDQGPDTLPPLEEEPVIQRPARPPGVNVVSSGGARRQPIRAERRLALLGELGWNSLAGFGVNVSFHAHPRLSFDLGVGLAAIGGKVGLRARYNLLDKAVTPFVGAGVLAGSGFDAPAQDLAADDENRELNIQLEPSTFLQAVVGVDWTSRSGFTLVGALGYAWLLTSDPVEVITGVPTEEEERAFDVLFRSSIVISIAIGYSFR